MDDFADQGIPSIYRAQMFSLLRRAAEMARAGEIRTMADAAQLVRLIRATACSGGRSDGNPSPWEMRLHAFAELIEDTTGDIRELQTSGFCGGYDPSPGEVFRRMRMATKAAQAGE